MTFKSLLRGSLFIGACFGVGVYFVSLKSMALLDTGIRVPAEVVHLVFRSSGKSSGSGTYVPIFKYNVNNELFIEGSSSGSNPARYDVGESTYLIVNPKKPTEFLEPGFFSIWGKSLFLGLFSFVFSMIGGVGLYLMHRKAKRAAWLATHGRVINANVTSIGLDTSVIVNGRNPYKIVAQWQDPATGKTHHFDSGPFLNPLWHDPSAHVTDTIGVQIDPNDPSVYDMVLTDIPRDGP